MSDELAMALRMHDVQWERANRLEAELAEERLTEISRAALANAIAHYVGPNDDTILVLRELLDRTSPKASS